MSPLTLTDLLLACAMCLALGSAITIAILWKLER